MHSILVCTAFAMSAISFMIGSVAMAAMVRWAVPTMRGNVTPSGADPSRLTG